MKYLIPSRGRSKVIGGTLDVLGKKDTLVYVHESEKDDYSKYINKSQLRTHNVQGIASIRKFMYEENKDRDYIYQLDDDVNGFEYKWMDRMTIIVDPDHIRSIIDNLYMVASDIKTPLFGVAAGVGPKLYTQLTLCYFSGFINAMGTGIIPKLMGDINYDTRFNVMHEDHDLSLQVKYHKRYIFIDGRYSVRVNEVLDKKYGGGLSLNRDMNEYGKCHALLKRKYGTAIGENPKNKYLGTYRVVLHCGF